MPAGAKGSTVPQEFFLPQCASEVYRFLFPTLDWSRIHFFQGIPFPLHTGQSGITIASIGFSGKINIYLEEGVYYPCGPDGVKAHESFLIVAHELVHALQIQQSLGEGYIPGSWVTKYVTCFLTSLSADCSNEIEQEAYEYANGCPRTYGGTLRLCTDSAGLHDVGPCDCSGIPPFRETVVAAPDPETFLEAIQNHCPLIPKRDADVTIDIWSCIGKLCKKIPVLGCLLGLGAFLIGAIIGLLSIFGLPGLTSTLGRITTGAGAIAGAVIGGIVGGILGAVVGFIAGAFIGAIVGGILDSLFGAVGDFFSGLGGGGAHSLNLLFSSDDAKSFGNKSTFARSSEPPALAFGPLPPSAALFVLWTDTDDHLNILRAPQQSVSRFWEANDDCGPGVVSGLSSLFMTWQDGDNHLFIARSPGHLPPPYIGQSFGGAFQLPGSSQDSASPALAFDAQGARLYFAWVDGDGHIFLSSSAEGQVWDPPFAVRENSVGDGTPAVAFGHGKLYLAWTGTDDDNHLNVLALVPSQGSYDRAAPKNTLRERSSGDAGPTIAFGNDRLFLAWTDDNDRVKVAASADDGQTFGPAWDGGEHSSDNAGPALAYLEGSHSRTPGLLCLAWIGTD